MQMTVPRTICLGFLVLIAIGTILLALPISSTQQGWGDPLVAMFTTTSAVCVTGLVAVDMGTCFSDFSEATILVLIQVGGLGYMTVNTFLLLLGRRLGLRERLAAEKKEAGVQ